jgi:hypothetical protein
MNKLACLAFAVATFSAVAQTPEPAAGVAWSLDDALRSAFEKPVRSSASLETLMVAPGTAVFRTLPSMRKCYFIRQINRQLKAPEAEARFIPLAAASVAAPIANSPDCLGSDLKAIEAATK